MRILVIPDIHGRHEKFQNALDEFEKGGYGLCIQLGDLADSYDRSNEDILRCFYMSRDMKDKHGDKYIQLWGNHDWQYLFGRMMCSGFRGTLSMNLNPWLNDNKDWFQVAYQHEGHLFTHAGIQRKWYDKHIGLIGSFLRQEDHNHGYCLADALNDMWASEMGRDALYEVGVKRGGLRGDYGGPMWCDRVEMESYGPIKGLHQIVGHTPQKFPEKITKFEGGKQYKNTSVTFCDIIEQYDKFWTIIETP